LIQSLLFQQNKGVERGDWLSPEVRIVVVTLSTAVTSAVIDAFTQANHKLLASNNSLWPHCYSCPLFVRAPNNPLFWPCSPWLMATITPGQ